MGGACAKANRKKNMVGLQWDSTGRIHHWPTISTCFYPQVYRANDKGSLVVKPTQINLVYAKFVKLTS